ncbi:meiosis mei2 [Fusarium pseudocircinatum]|uniref:Meiosis mei2 n=1 Tax=Fusarium pseudocircinatum TaxID=56676 RepID=A0A8H5KJ23_9HYPO|nr:meiosis mei2 [Fusarium pseudocircinatum]
MSRTVGDSELGSLSLCPAKADWRCTRFTAYVKIRPERLDPGLVRFSELRQLSIEVNVLSFAIIDPAHVDEIAQVVVMPVKQLGLQTRRRRLPGQRLYEMWGDDDAGE